MVVVSIVVEVGMPPIAVAVWVDAAIVVVLLGSATLVGGVSDTAGASA